MPVLYSDKTIINRSDCGFILNFYVAKQEGALPEELIGQVGLSPEYAKRLLVHLYTEVGKFEAQFGEIRVPNQIVTELKSQKKPSIGFSLNPV